MSISKKIKEELMPRAGEIRVKDVRIGKVIEFKVDAASSAEAEEHVRQMCERLLANPVIEDYRLEIVE